VSTGIHVREDTEGSSDAYTPDRKATLGAATEDVRHLTLKSERVEGSRRSVKVRVSRRPCGDEEYGIRDRGQSRNTGVNDGDDERRLSRGSGTVEQIRVVGRDEDGDDEDTANVEDEEAIEDTLDRSGNGLTWVLSLAESGCDDLGTDEREGSLHKDVPEC